MHVISISERRCKRCGICIDGCPRKVLAPDPLGRPTVKEAALCTACRMCERKCPDFAIRVEE